MTDGIFMLASRRLPRLMQAVAVDIVQPTVIDASYTSILNTAVTQIGPSMGAMKSQ
jgi:hypothetical protein